MQRIGVTSEQFNGELDHLDVRLERHHGEYADAKAVLTRCRELLDNLAGLYARCDDLTRRPVQPGARHQGSTSRTT